VYRLGILSPAEAPLPSERGAAVALVPAALRELGYVEGHNLVVERRFAAGHLDRLPALARELVAARMDAIFAVAVAAVAAKAATTTIPIVMVNSDPIGQGLVASLSKPGGNVTGLVISETGLADKRLELLSQVLPRAKRLAVLSTHEADAGMQVREAQKAAAALGLTVIPVEVRAADYQRAFAVMVAERADGFVAVRSTILNRDRIQIIRLAAKHRLPAIYQFREHAEDGGLMAYGSNIAALSRRAAAYIDRIFKGESPANLPVEQPTALELVINLKTAKALGLTIPPSLLLRADQLIE
jgi:putative ABC transport system substrate-binding protein